MSVNLLVQDGIVKSPALRYDSHSKPEFRFTLDQQEGEFHLWLPCCASGSAAERLASEIEDGQHIIITSGKLCYRKRQTQKSGEVSRLEILCWSVEVLSESVDPERTDVPEGHSGLDDAAINLEPVSVPLTKKTRQPRLPKASRLTWSPENAN